MYNTLHSTELKSLWENTAVPVSLADAIILRGKKEWFPKQNKAKGNTASVWLLLFDIFPPRKTVYFYNGLFQQSQQIHKTSSCKTYSGNSDGRHCSDIQTILHPCWTGHQAPLFPDKRQVDPCFPEHTLAEMKERGPHYPCCCYLELLQAQSLSLSPPVPAAPSRISQSVPKNQAAESYKSVSITGNPSNLGVPSSTPHTPVRTSLAQV